jgi:DNA-binding NarL/FixJ family response regulator
MEPTVLIVDDDPGFRAALAELLADRGYRIVGEAASVNEGAALAAALAPDAVVCDVHLPDGDGASLAAQLAAGAKRPRVLLISSDPDALAGRSLDKRDPVGFVHKTDLVGADLDLYLRP